MAQGNIHLHSRFQREFRNNSDIDYIYLAAGLAFFLLLMACVNFTNLATARSAYRSREVGTRKAVGAYRLQLVGQFLGESVLLAFAALLAAAFLAWVALPGFAAFMERPLRLRFDMVSCAALAFLGLSCGLGAGLYPALRAARSPQRSAAPRTGRWRGARDQSRRAPGAGIGGDRSR